MLLSVSDNSSINCVGSSSKLELWLPCSRVFIFTDKARKHLIKNSLKKLYHAYIYSYLAYCIELWGCASECHLNSLFLLQKKILRIMTFSPYLARADPLFKSLEILPIDKFFIDRIGITMFKVTYELVPKFIHQLFSKNKDIH